MISGLEIMLAELESNRLEAVLVPLKRHVNEGGMRRVCASKNCAWYRAFCAGHGSRRKRNHRKFDTKIKRQGTLRALNKLIAGQSGGLYGPELMRIAERLERKAA